MIIARSPIRRLLLFVVLLCAVFLAWHGLPLDEWWLGFLDWLRELGNGALIVYAAVYIIATLVLVPLAPLAIGAGYLFGLWPAFAVTLLAAVTGAIAAFMVARGLLASTFQRILSRHPIMAAAEHSVIEQGWLIVFLLRLSPIIPSHLLNYLCGITEIPARHYVLATLFGKAPLIFLLSYIGAATAETLTQAPQDNYWQLLFYAAGLLFTALACWLIVRHARQILHSKGLGND